MRQSRIASVAVLVLGWALSLFLTGFLPSLFTLCILVSGVSLNRFVLILLAKVRDLYPNAANGQAMPQPSHRQSHHSPSARATRSSGTSTGCTTASRADTTWATRCWPPPWRGSTGPMARRAWGRPSSSPRRTWSTSPTSTRILPSSQRDRTPLAANTTPPNPTQPPPTTGTRCK